MNSENGQIKKRPVSQTGTGLVKYIWAAGDYAAVVAAEFLALFFCAISSWTTVYFTWSRSISG